MSGEDTHSIGEIYGRLAKLWPATGTLTDLYQGVRRYSERAGEWVPHVAFIDRIYGGVANLWPTAETFTDLYQGLPRRSGRAVSEWVTLARKNGNAALVPQLWSRIANLLPRNGKGRGTAASPRRKEAGGEQRSSSTTPE